MPSSSCVGIRVPGCPSVSAAAAAEQDEDEQKKDSTFPMERTLKQLKLLDGKVSIACGGVSSRLHPPTSLGKRGLQKAGTDKGTNNDKEAATPNNGGEKDNNEHLWKRLLFGDGGLKWFVDALGGEEAAKRMFANAYLNIQSISKPLEVAQAAAAAAAPAAHSSSSTSSSSSKKNKCIPWALVRLAESEACICCHSAMQVPFKGFKQHKRNGVVFCFFGSRVFVTCMDEECTTELKRRKQV